jgi:hypothetical protein
MSKPDQAMSLLIQRSSVFIKRNHLTKIIFPLYKISFQLCNKESRLNANSNCCITTKFNNNGKNNNNNAVVGVVVIVVVVIVFRDTVY